MGRMVMLLVPNPAKKVKVPPDLHEDRVWYLLILSIWSRALAWLGLLARDAAQVSCDVEML
jgi:hypothetical protein